LIIVSYLVQTDVNLNCLQKYIDKLIISKLCPKLKKCNFLRHDNIIIPNDVELYKLYDRCSFLTISERVEYYTIKQLYKFLFHDYPPSELKEMIKFKQITRSSKYAFFLEKPCARTTLFQKSFVFRAINLWNDLIIKNSAILDLKDKPNEFFCNIIQYVMRHRNIMYV